MKIKHRTVTALISAFVTVTAFVLTCFVGCAASRSAEGIVLNTVRAAETSAAANEASPQAENSYILTATVKPDNASNKNVVWSCYWNGTTSKNINDYFKLTPNGNSATVTCLARFDTQIVVKAASEENGSIFATTLVDYCRKPIEYVNGKLSPIKLTPSAEGGAGTVKVPILTEGTIGEFTPYVKSGDGGDDEVSYFNLYPRTGAPDILAWEKATYYDKLPWFSAIPGNYIWWSDYCSIPEEGDLYGFSTSAYYSQCFGFRYVENYVEITFNLKWFDRWGCEMSYYTNAYGESEGTSPHLKEYVKENGIMLETVLYYDYVSPDGVTERKCARVTVELDNTDIK